MKEIVFENPYGSVKEIAKKLDIFDFGGLDQTSFFRHVRQCKFLLRFITNYLKKKKETVSKGDQLAVLKR